MDAAYYRQEIINISRGIIEGWDPEDVERGSFAEHQGIAALERRAGSEDHAAFIVGLASVIEGADDIQTEAQLIALEYAKIERNADPMIIQAVVALHRKIPMDLTYEDTDPPPPNWQTVELRGLLITYINLVARYLRTELALP